MKFWVEDPTLVGVVDCYPFFNIFLSYRGSFQSSIDAYNHDLDFSIILIIFVINLDMLDDL